MVTLKKVPKGCDQQGRYPEAAEAATEVGADSPPERNALRDFVEDVAAPAVLLIALGAAILLSGP